MNNIDVFLVFLATRLASVFLVQTYFVPDEYWQSLEVAHKFAFGYGYLTWEWVLGIRNYIHPLIIAFIFKVLQIFGLDSATLIIYTPKVLQALLSSYSDLCFYRWSGTRKWAIFSITSAWFWFYTSTRLLINTFECCLTTIALSKFPWLGKSKDVSSSFLWVVALLCYIRPTAIILWLPICLYHLLISPDRILITLVAKYFPIGVIVAIFSILVDSLAHGKFIVTPYNFFKYNVFYNISEFYGTQPWYWYLSTGFPAILGIHFIPFVMATIVIIKNKHSHPNELALLGCITFTLTVYSFLKHKEFRFILPLLPIVLYISSRYLSAWSRKAKVLSIWLVAAVILIGNVVPAWYLSFVHQRGTLSVIEPLREVATKNSNVSVLFLMPCHSTPLYSYLHVNVSVRFLTCEPDFSGKTDYVDEADIFYKNPNSWLRAEYPPNGTLPSHIVTFDSLIPSISDILSRYKPTHRFFHTSLPSGRIGRHVIIHQRIDFEL